MQPAAAQLAEKLQRALVLRQEERRPGAGSIYLRKDIEGAANADITALNRLGVIAAQTDDFNRALYLFDKAIETDPANAAAHGNRGLALHRLERLDAALASYDRALAIEPDKADAHLNRGNVLKDLGQWQAALENYDRAIELKPDYAEAFSNSGYVLKELGRVNEALTRYARAVAINPGYVNAHCNRAFTLLSAGDLEHGWAEYECGAGNSSAAHARRSPIGWERNEIAGKTMLLHGEQGLGDTLQFCRSRNWLRTWALASSGGSKAAEALARRRGRGRAGHRDRKRPASFRFSMLLDEPALGVWNPSRHHPIRDRLSRERCGGGRRVESAKRRAHETAPMVSCGAAAGRTPMTVFEASRSSSCCRTCPRIFTTYACKPTCAATQIPQTLGANPRIIDPGDERRDFGDTAALAECIDIVISVDAECGASRRGAGQSNLDIAAVQCQLALASESGRGTIPWYSQVKLYRQDRIGDWSGVFGQLERDLARLSDSR